METILASIKRVISADAEAARRLPPVPRAAPHPIVEEDVLELGPPDDGEALVSGATAQASKAALAALSSLSSIGVDPRAEANTLDGLVREMLRPMLKQWLDAHLPDLVERIVAREVARVIGR